MAKIKMDSPNYSEELDRRANEILKNITNGSFPQMRLKNNGVHREITKEDVKRSGELIYKR